jgi:hypothetical protein
LHKRKLRTVWRAGGRTGLLLTPLPADFAPIKQIRIAGLGFHDQRWQLFGPLIGRQTRA